MEFVTSFGDYKVLQSFGCGKQTQSLPQVPTVGN